MFSHHPAGVMCAHVSQVGLEPAEEMVPLFAVAREEPKNYYLLLSTKLIMGIIYSDGQSFLSSVNS